MQHFWFPLRSVCEEPRFFHSGGTSGRDFLFISVPIGGPFRFTLGVPLERRRVLAGAAVLVGGLVNHLCLMMQPRFPVGYPGGGWIPNQSSRGPLCNGLTHANRRTWWVCHRTGAWGAGEGGGGERRRGFGNAERVQGPVREGVLRSNLLQHGLWSCIG